MGGLKMRRPTIAGRPRRVDHRAAPQVRPFVSERVARRAAELRTKAHKGSAVDALVVAIAELGSAVLTSRSDDLRALAANAADVIIDVI